MHFLGIAVCIRTPQSNLAAIQFIPSSPDRKELRKNDITALSVFRRHRQLHAKGKNVSYLNQCMRPEERDPIRDAPVTPSGDSSAKSRLGGVRDSRKSEGDGLKWAIVEEQDEGRDPGVDSQVKIAPM